MKRNRSYLLSATLALCTTAALAQTSNSNTPYSRYGFGLLSDQAQGFNKGMAGLAYGMRSTHQLNTQNPAAISAIDSLTFLYDVGITLQNANLAEGANKENLRNASFDYLTAGFRLHRGLGLYIGMRPFSAVGYKMTTNSHLPDLNAQGEQQIIRTFNGEGGFNEAGIGLGWAPFKRLSFGAEANYFWGEYKHSILTKYTLQTIQPRNRFYTANINSYRLSLGAQYTQPLGTKHTVTLGAVYRLGHNINNDALFYDQSISAQGNLLSADTLVVRRAFELPMIVGGGVTWNYNNRLRLGVDYTLEKWRDTHFPALNADENYTLNKDYFSNRQVYTLGADYMPRPDGLRYRDHIQYRLGARYATPYTNINGQTGPKSFLVSAGIGLPISNMYSVGNVLNVSLQWEHIKPAFSHQMTENYLRISIGLTFNERWFMKWKVE